ncbi:hypothetical protein [Clostridium sp.]|nr:hypothetical protein [Clostridium sp.]MBK5239898.1 hypothetical protein [Clostridium sp.]
MVLKETLKYYIESYEFEDMVQQGYFSVIKAIGMHKLGRMIDDKLLFQ